MTANRPNTDARSASPVPTSAVAIVAVVAGFVTIGGTAAIMIQQGTTYSHARIGGAFAMIDTDGKRVSEADLLGKPSVLFFGYTACPDVCPTTLSLLTTVMSHMGPSADRLRVFFVSLDPAHDTPDQMKSYLASFDPRIRGLTGTEQQMSAMAAAYHIAHKRVDAGDGTYTLLHSADALLLDNRASVVGEIYYGETETSVEAKLRALAPEPVCRPGAEAPDLWSATGSPIGAQLCGTETKS